VAILEVSDRSVGQFTFLLLAALIERTGSIICRVELPVIEGNGPHTHTHTHKNTPNMTSDCCFTTLLIHQNVVNSNLILPNRKFLWFQVLVDISFVSSISHNFSCVVSFCLYLF